VGARIVRDILNNNGPIARLRVGRREITVLFQFATWLENPDIVMLIRFW